MLLLIVATLKLIDKPLNLEGPRGRSLRLPTIDRQTRCISISIIVYTSSGYRFYLNIDYTLSIIQLQ